YVAGARLLAEIFHELAEPRLEQGRNDLQVIELLGALGKADEFLQRQLRQLHILRGIEGLHPVGKDDVSGSIRPQAVNRLYEGGLAAAGLSLDEGPFARPEAHIADRQER